MLHGTRIRSGSLSYHGARYFYGSIGCQGTRRVYGSLRRYGAFSRLGSLLHVVLAWNVARSHPLVLSYKMTRSPLGCPHGFGSLSVFGTRRFPGLTQALWRSRMRWLAPMHWC